MTNAHPRRRLGWQQSDTVRVLAGFLLPMVTAAMSFASIDTFAIGNFSSIELDYFTWAAIGVALCIYKSTLLIGDLYIAVKARRDWRYVVGGVWTLSNSVGIGMAFVAWVIAGTVAGQFPTNRSATIDNTPAAFITALAFMSAEGVLIGVIVLGLTCRVRLAETL